MNRDELITQLHSIYDKWEELLGRMNVEDIVRPRFERDWSVKDFIAHLWAWQQISVARFEAALRGGDPSYPAWLQGTDPFVAEEHTEVFNARVRAGNQDRSWADVHQDWSQTFLRLIDLAERTPDDALFEEGRYTWLMGYPLSGVLTGSLEHHEEHYEEISAAVEQMT